MKRVKKVMRITYLVRHLRHKAPLRKRQKTCVDSFKPLGIALRMGTKGIKPVGTRSLATTAIATTANTKNKIKVKYTRSTRI